MKVEEEIWLRALAEPLGLLVKTAEPTKARQALYLARSKMGDPSISHLSVRIVDWDGASLAITKGEVICEPILPEGL